MYRVLITIALLALIPAFYASAGLTGAFFMDRDKEGCEAKGVCAPTNNSPVPDVVGKSVKDACQSLKKRGYAGGIFAEKVNGKIAPGHVLAQEPKDGYRGAKGQLVHLVVRNLSPRKRWLRVPTAWTAGETRRCRDSCWRRVCNS